MNTSESVSGAASFFKGRRFSNTKDIRKYVQVFAEHGEYEHIEKIRNIDEELTADRLMEEYMFLGLLHDRGG